MSELKILIHIGHHLNVVNLLGACTKAGGEECSGNQEQKRKEFSDTLGCLEVPVVQSVPVQPFPALLLLQDGAHPHRAPEPLPPLVSELKFSLRALKGGEHWIAMSAQFLPMGISRLLLPLLPCLVRRMHQAEPLAP